MSVQSHIETRWYGRPGWLWLLLPISGLFWLLSVLRKRYQQAAAKSVPTPGCPVIIIGNIAVGGTGKTPLIIALAKLLQAEGFSPAVVSRGYGAQFTGTHKVTADAEPSLRGDEPVLIAQQVNCPVLVTDNRIEAACLARREHGADVILCDDGLQHYRLPRSYELVVIDAARGLGNGWCLPVGPLRELPSRLLQANWVFINGDQTRLPPKLARKINSIPHCASALQAVHWVNIRSGEVKPLEALAVPGQPTEEPVISAVAGIGNPQRFFDTLLQLDLIFKPHVFPDHHAFTAEDFAHLPQGKTVVMTQKDAVKCQPFAQENWWALVVEFTVPKLLATSLVEHCRHERAHEPGSAKRDAGPGRQSL